MRSPHYPLGALAALIVLAAPSAAQQSHGGQSAVNHATVAMTHPHQWTREQVMEAQRGLAASKLYRGKVDGIIGPETEAAIREYQRAHQLTVDGQLSNELLQRLSAGARPPTEQPGTPSPGSPNRAPAQPAYRPEPVTPTTKRGAAPAPVATPRTEMTPAMTHAWSRDEVVAAQQGLTRAGVYHGAATGTVDQLTMNAIREFQRTNGLPVTGELSNALLTRLKAFK